jgi:hypothetical protein
MTSERKQLIDQEILGSLQQCGDYLLPEPQLLTEANLKVRVPRLMVAEFDERLRHLESRRLIIAAEGEYGRKWKLTEAGRVHCAENL